MYTHDAPTPNRPAPNANPARNAARGGVVCKTNTSTHSARIGRGNTAIGAKPATESAPAAAAAATARAGCDFRTAFKLLQEWAAPAESAGAGCRREAPAREGRRW